MLVSIVPRCPSAALNVDSVAAPLGSGKDDALIGCVDPEPSTVNTPLASHARVLKFVPSFVANIIVCKALVVPFAETRPSLLASTITAPLPSVFIILSVPDPSFPSFPLILVSPLTLLTTSTLRCPSESHNKNVSVVAVPIVVLPFNPTAIEFAGSSVI